MEKHLGRITNHKINVSPQWSAITERKCRTNSYFPDALNEVWYIWLGRDFYLHCGFSKVKHPLSVTKSETNATCFEGILKKMRLFSVDWRRELLFLKIKNAAVLRLETVLINNMLHWTMLMNVVSVFQIKYYCHHFTGIYTYIHEGRNVLLCSGKTNELKILVDKSFFSQRLFWGNSLLMERKSNSNPKPFT